MEIDSLKGIELFISHASEDKDALVRPLAKRLREVGVKVWYDEFTLTAGDSVSRSIDKGLSVASFGLVIISNSFIGKPWPEYELRGLTTKEIANPGKVIIPVWHDVTHADVLEFSPSLADKKAVVTSGLAIDEVTEAVLRAIRPDLAERMSILRRVIQSKREGSTTERYPIEKLAPMPVPDEFNADPHIIIRVMNVVSTLADASDIVGDFSTFLIDLYRDLHPEPELRIWEMVAATFSLTEQEFDLSRSQRRDLVRLLVGCAIGSESAVENSRLPQKITSAAVSRWIELMKLSRNDQVRVTTEGLD